MIDVLNTNGIYTVFCRITGGNALPVNLGPDGEPPEDSWPVTYGSLNEVRRNYPSTELNVIGETQKQSEKVVAPLSDFEVNTFLKEAGIAEAQEKFSKMMEEFPASSASLEKKQDAMIYFKEAYLEYIYAPPKKKDLFKSYCNGMANIIQLVWPDSRKDLERIVEGNKTKKDLL